MSLSSIQTDAFLGIVRSGSFSAAAKTLHLTQSALSQRILNLEESLGAPVLRRERSGVQLTELGQRLLRYCQAKERLEAELLGPAQESGALSGLIRITGFSTVTRSLLIPALAPFLRLHPLVRLELVTAELREIPKRLVSGQADFALTLEPVSRPGFRSRTIGVERNVLIEPARAEFPREVYLDHDAEDATTYEFLRRQSRSPPAFRRCFLGDIDAILAGVRSGLGRAVVPLHLARSAPGTRIVSGYRPLDLPVYLSEESSHDSTRLHREAGTWLERELGARLGS